MITAPQLRTLLDGLARRFENRPQSEDEFAGSGALGWGQFLDGQPKHNQVGPFGTCAGVITRALAGRGRDQLDAHVNTLIEHWWAARSTSASHAKFLGQTIRLAMLHLAIRLKDDSSLAVLAKELEETLLNDIRSDQMWGNYNMPGNIEDPSPRLIASSLVVLSFMLFRREDERPPDVLVETVKKIEDRILGTETLPRLHVAIASAAILSMPGYTPQSEVRAKISRLAYATQVSLPELGVYFYDYEFEEDQAGHAQAKKQIFKTDYFIVPTELVLGIAGYQPKAPMYLRFRAESNLKLLVKNLQGFDGFYRPDNEQRISSVNQGWVAIYLALAERTAMDRSSLSHDSARWFSRLWYECIRQRPDRFWLDSVMLSISALGILLGSMLPYSGVNIESILAKGCVAALAFISGRLYAPIFIKSLFVERQ